MEATVCLEHMHFDDIAVWATRHWKCARHLRSLKVTMDTKCVPDLGDCTLSIELRYNTDGEFEIAVLGAPEEQKDLVWSFRSMIEVTLVNKKGSS